MRIDLRRPIAERASFAIFVLLLSGCASVSQDVKQSGPLVPLLWVSRILSGVGDIGARAATSFHDARPSGNVEELDEITVTALEEFAVEVPQSTLDYPDGIGFGRKKEDGFGLPLPARVTPLLLDIERMVGRKFRWFLSERVSIARAYPPNVIVVNPEQVGVGRTDSQLLILLHEAGHHLEGHWKAVESHGKPLTPQFSRSLELEADAYAARIMLAERYKAHEVVLAAMTAFKGAAFEEDEEHPSPAERIQAIRTIVTNP